SELRKQRVGMQCSRAQALRLAAATVLFLICVACCDTYRPLAQPILGPSPNASAVHFVYAISTNGNDALSSSGSCSPSGSPPPCVADPGAFSRIDVSGDSVSSRSEERRVG